ncbi:NAD(P)-dependent alcohol dehydrogenase [Streptomyces sp. DG2A-72]|uniref:NAD(P)-dependent alcohol dehydrogenase n=1 Tax=Streptomyces sp. DG2A-72 TaxID=3051386 RepID=UPI00265C37E1|nr:NAD(P)-dependent alcohol dehydrogenase [Streptomyces sp. DG2A-72]MDO0938617.1 NAD(P)-dependent alcohol dehydrogenase [Streptomyces sp. DG2A-72]
MKAVIQDRYCSADELEFREVDRPVPKPDQVLVRVRAASVNAKDWHMMHGDPKLMRISMGLRAPKLKIRGNDFAGRVEAVGSEVKGLHPGDEVFGETDGTFAEYACARAATVAPKPPGLTFEQAAAIPLAGCTALMGLRDVARVRSGQTILINGASGGVGTFAVQLAKVYGLDVTAVCRTRNVDMVRSLGADHVVDYSQEDFTRSGRRYDVVLDLVGNKSLSEFRSVLTPTGTLVLSGGGTYDGGTFFGPMSLFFQGRAVGRFVRHRVVEISAVVTTEYLTTLGELAESGKVVPVIDRTYPFAEIPEAIRYLEMEHARAKVVITV